MELEWLFKGFKRVIKSEHPQAKKFKLKVLKSGLQKKNSIAKTPPNLKKSAPDFYTWFKEVR
jgi:hypothetical protein